NRQAAISVAIWKRFTTAAALIEVELVSCVRRSTAPGRFGLHRCGRVCARLRRVGGLLAALALQCECVARQRQCAERRKRHQPCSLWCVSFLCTMYQQLRKGGGFTDRRNA